MPKKKSLTKSSSSQPPSKFPIPEPPITIRLTSHHTKLIHAFAARANLDPYEFLIDACRQVDAANLIRARAAAAASRPPDVVSPVSSSAPTPDPPKADEEPA